MALLNIRGVLLATAVAVLAGATWWAYAQTTKPTAPISVKPIVPVAGMPNVPDPANLYSETVSTRMSANVANALPRVYVPNRGENTVSVIDPATLKVINKFKVGVHPQHVVPSWDLRTLWVANNAEGRTDGSLTPIDPTTGKPGANIAVDDPYNMYFSPDGQYAIVVAEAFKRLDFRDPRTMKLSYTIETPKCAGINHADFSIDGRYAFFTCEFNGSVTKMH
jgi:YVTN family beta-propeller protein